MRTIVTVVVALSLAACTSGRGRGEYAEGPGPDGGVVAAPAPQTAPSAPRAPVGATLAPATGPMDAGALARETGMQVQDLGSSVLLSGSDVRARFVPGTDRVSIDGRSTPMGAVARREAGGLVVPAGGVDAVRRALRDAAAQRPRCSRSR
jgi:hypothetical protein